MAERGDTFPDAELHRLARGVCLIEILIEMKDSVGKRVTGTGFHYGGGWVMSVAHNFQDDKQDTHNFQDDKKDAHNYQDDDRDTSKIHSLIKTAKFTFCTKPGPVIDADGAKGIKLTSANSVVFNPQKRMAFIHHLEPGEDVDIKNEDIAMIKLGHQWKYVRDEKDCKEWEIGEQDILDKNKLPAFVSCINNDLYKVDEEGNTPIIEPEVDDEVYAMHFGGNCHNMKLVRSKITKKTERSTNEDGSVKNVPMLHLNKPGTNCPFPEGASGCLVLTKPRQTGKYGLVGLHFSGDDDDKDGTAEALQWTKGIWEYIKKGIEIIKDSETYLSNKAASTSVDMPGFVRDRTQKHANDARETLLGNAKKNNLTIYLPTEVLNGPPEEALNG